MAGEARVDHVRLEPVRRPEQERAEEERREPDSDRGVPAEQRDRDPQEPDRREPGRLTCPPCRGSRACRARPRGRRTPRRSPSRDVVRAHLDPAVRGRFRVVADRPHLVAERRPVEDRPEDDQRGDRDEEADVQALELGVAPEHGQLRALRDVARDRDVERLVLRALERPALLEEVAPDPVRDPVEHDRRDHLVGADRGLEEAGDRGPGGPGERGRANAEQDVSRAGHVDEASPDPARDEEPHEVLALAADVEEPAAEGERDREPRQDQGRRLEERLAEVVGRRVGGVDVPRVREPVEPRAWMMSLYARSGLWPVARTTRPPIANASTAVTTGTEIPPARCRRSSRPATVVGGVSGSGGFGVGARPSLTRRPLVWRRASPARSLPRSPARRARRRARLRR